MIAPSIPDEGVSRITGQPSPSITALDEEHIPTVLSLDPDGRYVIGTEARALGIRNRTNAFNFKMHLGDDGDSAFRNKKIFWIADAQSSNDSAPSVAGTFTAKEIATEFLRLLLAKLPNAPQKLIFGEPHMPTQWRENFRGHLREILKELGVQEVPQFFPEPFAVFQYYRHMEKLIPEGDQPLTVLIIDFGGGTFNTCVIQTTKRGDLARSGITSKPLGIDSCPVAGTALDRDLLETLRNRAKSEGVIFKDDPMERAEEKQTPFLIVEDAKISLSERFAAQDTGGEQLLDLSETVRLPASTFAAEELTVALTAHDLREVINHRWRTVWGERLTHVVNEASKILGSEIDRLHKILVAGGSSQLPFIRDLVAGTFPQLVDKADILVAQSSPAAIAYGIALECREQSRRDPTLRNNSLARCIMSDLYITVSRTRLDSGTPPKVTSGLAAGSRGQVIVGPLLLPTSSLSCELELPFEPSGTLYYYFTKRPELERAFEQRLNISDYALRVPDGRVRRHCTLRLHITEREGITPEFVFKVKRKGTTAETVRARSFFATELTAVEGATFCGVDFGMSNSFAVRFFQPDTPEPESAGYPELAISQRTVDRLRDLELRLSELRDTGRLDNDRVARQARAQKLDFVFHSNKIEGNQLTKGETLAVWNSPRSYGLSDSEREAANLASAYDWAFENAPNDASQFEAFAREVNRQILEGNVNEPGSYRMERVEISGTDFKPPPSGSVPDYMQRLGAELRDSSSSSSMVELAARAHTKLVWIHPFVDGNGRTGRLVMNAMLTRGVRNIRRNYLRNMLRRGVGCTNTVLTFAPPPGEVRFKLTHYPELPLALIKVTWPDLSPASSPLVCCWERRSGGIGRRTRGD